MKRLTVLGASVLALAVALSGSAASPSARRVTLEAPRTEIRAPTGHATPLRERKKVWGIPACC